MFVYVCVSLCVCIYAYACAYTYVYNVMNTRCILSMVLLKEFVIIELIIHKTESFANFSNHMAIMNSCF